MSAYGWGRWEGGGLRIRVTLGGGVRCGVKKRRVRSLCGTAGLRRGGVKVLLGKEEWARKKVGKTC